MLLSERMATKSKKLIERLEAMTFESMQNPKDPLYSNELVKLIKESKKVGSKSVAWMKILFSWLKRGLL